MYYAHMIDYAEALRQRPPYWARARKVYTDRHLADFYAELKRQAADGRNPRVISGYSWQPLEAIAGPDAFEVFAILEKRGFIKTSVIPYTYGHAEHELLV
jgi:hypothetical protein